MFVYVSDVEGRINDRHMSTPLQFHVIMYQIVSPHPPVTLCILTDTRLLTESVSYSNIYSYKIQAL